MKTLKNGPQKLLIIDPNPFFHSPAQTTAHSPELVFSYYEISGADICSLICVIYAVNNSTSVLFLNSREDSKYVGEKNMNF